MTRLFKFKVVAILFVVLLLQGALCAQKPASPEDSLRQPLNTAPNDTSRITAYINLANYYFYNDMKRGQMLMDSAAALASKQTGIYYWQVLYYQRMATMHYRMGEIHNAYQAHLNRLRVAEHLGLKESVASTKGYIGLMYCDMGDFKKGADAILESIRELNAIGSFNRTPIQYNNLAAAYANIKDSAHLAIPALWKGLNIIDQYPNKITEIRLLTSLIRNYVEADSVAPLEQLLKRLEPLALKSNDVDGKAYLLLGRGVLRMHEGRYQEAEDLIQQYLRTSGTIFYRFNLFLGYSQLQKLFEKKGDYRKALYYAEQNFLIKDTIRNFERLSYTNMLEVQYENEKNQAKLKQKELELSQAEKIMWFLISGLAILIFMIILLYQQNQYKQKAYQKLAASNKKIKQQSTEMELLMRELHHRVKNNLQVISSLLNLQAFKTSDPVTAGLIREAQNRVEAMALIHQRLYKTQNVSTVDFVRFAGDLFEKLRYAYGFYKKEINYEIQIEPDTMDVDSAIPLGLILNELLSNSFKYGFLNTLKIPALKISLHKEPAGHYLFTYCDNGPGIESTGTEKPHEGFGIQLIGSLSKQLKGEHVFWSDNGYHFKLTFKPLKEIHPTSNL